MYRCNAIEWYFLSHISGTLTRTTQFFPPQVLRLSQVTLGKISTGHVVNLTSNDVQRFDFAFLLLNFLWISPLHLALFTYLVYQEVGWPAFPATAFVVLQVPLQILMAHIFGRLRWVNDLVSQFILSGTPL